MDSMSRRTGIAPGRRILEPTLAMPLVCGTLAGVFTSERVTRARRSRQLQTDDDYAVGTQRVSTIRGYQVESIVEDAPVHLLIEPIDQTVAITRTKDTGIATKPVTQVTSDRGRKARGYG
jgi:hypothetical protein